MSRADESTNLTLRNNCILWLMCSPLFCVVFIRNFLARISIELCRIDMSPPLSEFKTPSVGHLREDTIYKLMMILLDVVVRVPFLEKKLFSLGRLYYGAFSVESILFFVAISR